VARSPLRGPWLTAVLGAVLLVGLPVLTPTGVLSFWPAHLPCVDWPTSPGSVLPELFAWPPAASVLQLLERLPLVMLVGASCSRWPPGQ